MNTCPRTSRKDLVLSELDEFQGCLGRPKPVVGFHTVGDGERHGDVVELDREHAHEHDLGARVLLPDAVEGRVVERRVPEPEPQPVDRLEAEADEERDVVGHDVRLGAPEEPAPLILTKEPVHADVHRHDQRELDPELRKREDGAPPAAGRASRARGETGRRRRRRTRSRPRKSSGPARDARPFATCRSEATRDRPNMSHDGSTTPVRDPARRRRRPSRARCGTCDRGSRPSSSGVEWSGGATCRPTLSCKCDCFATDSAGM